MRRNILALALTLVASAASAQTAPLKPELAGLRFLVGDWSSGRGAVADTKEAATGSSTVTVEANGAVLLRRDRTQLFDAAGKSTGGFGQIMMIYAEGGAIHADYSDGTHVIHYTSAAVEAGRSVVFTSAASAGAPIFRLAYEASDAATLKVAFLMQPPGSSTFNPIATGTLTKAR